MKTIRSSIPTTILIIALFHWGCSTNPATGKRNLSLVSEEQEISMGKQADQEIVGSLGIYSDAKLEKYIQDLGARLAATSERTKLPWTFRLVDDPVVNAFALPGGYIYITRGILSHLNSEAELAGVIGHEIGHVTGRHSVKQISKQQLTQLGFGLGMVFLPEMREYAGLVSGGLTLMFLKFGRDDESEADHLGIRYMTRSGENPREMLGVFSMLERVSNSAGGGRLPEWLSTHPDPGNRRESIAQQLDTMKGDLPRGGSDEAAYLSLLDGMVYGPNPREGYFRSTAFFHPELKFRFDFPQGWQTVNQKQAVGAVSPNSDAIIQITLAGQQETGAAASQFFSQEGIQASGTRTAEINGFPATWGSFKAQTEQGPLEGTAAFLKYESNVYQLLAYGSQQQWGTYESSVQQSINSFNRLTDPQALNVQPMRLKIRTLDQSTTIEQFAQQQSSPVPASQLALMNGVEANEQLSSGRKIKTVIGEKLE